MSLNREVLPTNVTPLHYELQFEPDFKRFTFDGVTRVSLRINDAAVDTITLNAFEIEFESVKFNGVAALSIDANEKSQVVEFKFPKGTVLSCAASNGGKGVLEIVFRGILNDQMAGFYRAKYTDSVTGETKYLATTQMEATDARKAFPCFDEPNLKATFEITLISTPELTNLSNMDVHDERVENGKRITNFNVSPKMSTYLVAFIVAELKYVENTEFRVPVRVYSTPGQEHLGQFSAKLGASTLKFFEDTFQIQYPLPKMDMVAVPEFSSGAMENWGLVTYRVADILLDAESSSLGRIQRVTEVVQHELAHQWFGNLVTMDWWESLWLNEGFATWMSWYSCNNFHPDWKVWEQYVTDNLQRAMSLDSLRSSHPIVVPVKNADEINQIFDAISYSKGSSLLRMIFKWLGEDVFIKGVSNYLSEFKYANAKAEALWDHLSAVSGKDVKSVMNVWTEQVGFPVVTVEENNNTLTVTQNRFLSTGDIKPEDDKVLYPVFLSMKTGDGVKDVTLAERSQKIDISNVKDNFFKMNADQAGFFITSYSNERWDTLGKQHHLLSVEDRVGLVADVKTLSSSGYTSSISFLNLVENWKDLEDSFVVWQQIANSFSALQTAWIFENDSIKNGLNKFLNGLVSDKINALGWDFDKSDDYALQQLKVTLFSTACSSKDPKAVSSAIRMFEEYASKNIAIPVLIKPAVFSTIATSAGTVENYDRLFSIYQNPANMDEKLAALKSLGQFNDPQLIQRTLSYLLDGTVLNQDICTPMVGLRSHKEGIEALWKWAKENWTGLVKRLLAGSPVLGHVVTVCTSGFTSEESIAGIKDFFSQVDTNGYNNNIAQAIDTITAKYRWVTRDSIAVKEYLSEHRLL
ncbi:arginine/alanine aminopeptidase KNAG_0B04890 [Huiozyma naganishii CBS 8797]|uniref:Aminopeptidase n=1 Tax=Huiozyma naganishii (strain ATCC MYA-139 / BCRC 22969 / CBS 8797 / KCTC 17520 / NBRC 10181 / NCYC 3082 / Yp74L-3) TaxID=1071383 RepID=J7RHA9_HUIN7|nr:hypothetical protein KNAG_0B04890 [Kazachstania naganishii CBS 8797]CCK68923.1 hypothetical protein KNAG_0B04890 [Kazachstania naganishii CBS 8797]